MKRPIVCSLLVGVLLAQASIGPARAQAPVAASPERDPSRGAAPEAYRIGPEDVLQISVWKNNDLTRQVLVRPDGKISMPLLNDVQAAGLTPLEYGSDIGGSIRVPAVFCGVYGHRPSETAMPRSGQFPMPPMPNAAVVMGVQGPLARSADDLELALDVAAGAEVGEDIAWQITIPPARRDRLADFRVAVLPAIDWVPVDVEIAAALENLAARLSRLGCQVKTAQPEGLTDHRQQYALYLTLLAAVTSSRVPAEQRRARLEVMRTRDDEWSAAFQRGIESGAPDYIAWFGQREQYRAAWRAFFREWDVLLAPAFIAPAYPHWDKPCPNTPASIRKTLDVNGTPVLEELGLFCAALATLAGQPATAFPAGRTRGGLPIGLQAIGPYLEDRTPIRFTALAARELGGFVRPPRYEGD